MTDHVLITGARAPVALDLARSFSVAGCAVTLADSAPAWAARLSRVGKGRRLVLPAARGNLVAYGEALAGWVDAHRPRLIVPTCEEVFYVAAAAEKYGFGDRVLAPSLDTLTTLHSKVRFAALAAELGLAAPETWRVTSCDDLARVPLPLNQLVLKPEFSRFGTATLISPTQSDIATLRVSPTAPWAAQAFVAGEEICLWAVARAGEIVAHACYRPLWRLGRAAGYAFERVKSAGALAVATTIAKALHITGQISFDLIVQHDGTVVPIECNPRAVSGVHLFDAAPDLARAMLGIGPAVTAQASLRYLAPAMVMIGLPSALGSNRLKAFVQDWQRGRDALTRPGDRLPALGALLDGALFAAIGLSRLRSAVGQSTDDIEWNGEPLL